MSAQYCSLEEAWGNIPTSDWNASPANKLNTPKRKHKSRQKEKERNERQERHTRKRNSAADYRNKNDVENIEAIEAESTCTSFTSPSVLKGACEDEFTSYGTVDFSTNPQTVGGVDDKQPVHDEKCDDEGEGEDDDNVLTDQRPRPEAPPPQQAENEWLKNQVSYLTTKVDALTKMVEEQERNNAGRTSNKTNTPDILLFLAVGLFFILILDAFFRAGLRQNL